MFFKFKFRFNSRALSTYFILSATGFSILLLIIWNAAVKSEHTANLYHDVDLIMNGVTGTISAAAELDSQGLQNQSQSLMQDYLNYTFQNRRNTQNRIGSVRISLLNPERAVVGEWVTPLNIPDKCLEKKTQFLHPQFSHYPYLIDLTVNTCSNSSVSLLEYHTLTTPILVAFAVILIWGVCIFTILNSVSFASKLLASTENTAELIDKTEQIRWSDVFMLTQKALLVRGRNLQYYQTLVLDSQHDIAKILDFILRKYDIKELTQNISAIRGIIQKLASEVRSSTGPYHDVTAHRHLSTSELLRLIQIYFVESKIENELPKNMSLFVNDISVFERILVNLASNAVKHGNDVPQLKIFLNSQKLILHVQSTLSEWQSILLYLARITQRIDTKNFDTPVYTKIFGRTGRGLSIIKRGLIQLGGHMLFEIRNKKLITGFSLPAQLSSMEGEIQIEKAPRARVIFFENQEFHNCAVALGLSPFMVSKEQLLNLISSGHELEIVSDIEFSIPDNFILRLITKKERIEGIAINWLGENKL